MRNPAVTGGWGLRAAPALPALVFLALGILAFGVLAVAIGLAVSIGEMAIPLGTIADRSGELDPDAEIVLQCKGGVRSAQALEILRGKGFKKLLNLKGGILAWSDEVDPSVPKY